VQITSKAEIPRVASVLAPCCVGHWLSSFQESASKINHRIDLPLQPARRVGKRFVNPVAVPSTLTHGPTTKKPPVASRGLKWTVYLFFWAIRLSG
jgi:hypothetical protein